MENQKEKVKILLVGWPEDSHKAMIETDLKNFSEEYEVILASQYVDALKEIAREFLTEKPILGIVFKREFLIKEPISAKSITGFAREYARYHGVLCAIGLVQSRDEKHLVFPGAYCSFEHKWVFVKNLLKTHVKVKH